MASDLTGATLGHFRLVARIGAGRCATTYRAFAGFPGEQQVAIKVLDGALTTDAAFQERFEKDVGLVSALGHPHLLPVYAHGRERGVTYVATALASGGSLGDLMQLGPLGPERAWPIISAVAEALHRAHEAGLVHRDVKPGNVLLDAAGRPLLADFGLARTYLGFAVGTPAYMAPEQAMGERPDRRSDVYALAAVVFEMLTGIPLRPASGSVAEQLRVAVQTVVPPASQVVTGLPVLVDAVLLRALAQGPSERYQTTVDLLHDLGLALGMHAALPPPSTGAAGAAPTANGHRDADAEFERLRAQLLRLVHDSLSAAIALDESSFIVGWNAVAERTFGWRRAEIVGRLLSTTLIPPRYQEAHERGFQRYLQGGEGPVIGTVVELTAMHRDGHELPVELSISPAVRSGSRAVVVGFVRDIGPERRARQARAARAAVAEGLRGARTLEEAGRRAVEAVGGHLAWSVGVLWLADGGAGALRCVYVWKAAGVQCGEFERATLAARPGRGEGLPGRVWETGDAVWVEDVLHEPPEPRTVPALRAGLHGAVAVPITSGERVRGVLELFAAGARHEDEDLLLRLCDIGRRVGRHTDPARLVER
jgi:PAS domain S-box-containing protein